MMSPQSDLEDTVERVRAERFPHLPADLVRQILKIEAQYVENRTEGLRHVKAAVQTYLDTSGYS